MEKETLTKVNFRPLAPSEFAYNPETYEQEMVDFLNAKEGDLKDYHCPVCKNKGVIFLLNKHGQRATRDCECMTIRKCIGRMKKSGLDGVVQQKRLDNYQTQEPWQKTILDLAREYVRQGSGWFLACGQTGGGKSHICIAISRERLLAGAELLYVTWPEEAARLKGMDFVQREARMEELRRMPVLYIDDLYKSGSHGETRLTPTDMSLVYTLVDARYRQNLDTIISTELTVPQMYELDAAVTGRIVERSGKFIATIEPDIRKNYRLRGKIAT